MTGPTSEPQRGGTNGWAIAAFVLGILGGTILSVIFAIVALFQIRDRRERGRSGRGPDRAERDDLPR